MTSIGEGGGVMDLVIKKWAIDKKDGFALPWRASNWIDDATKY